MKVNRSLSMMLCCTDNPKETFAWGVGIHETYVLHYVLSGRGFLETNGKTYTLQKGDSFIIFPGDVVQYYPDPDDPWRYTWVNFEGSEVPSLLSMTAFYENPVCHGTLDLTEMFNQFSRNMQYEYITQRNDGFLRVLLAHYIEIHPKQAETFAKDKLSFAKDYIYANSHRHQFNVSELAREIGMERSYLYRLFMSREGVSPSEYITDVRMKKALQMMKNGTTQLKFLSYSVGYTDPLYFSKLFKKKYGMSPTEFIKMYKNG